MLHWATHFRIVAPNKCSHVGYHQLVFQNLLYLSEKLTLPPLKILNNKYDDSLKVMQDEIESTLDKIELNIVKFRKQGKFEILVWEDGTFCDYLS